MVLGLDSVDIKSRLKFSSSDPDNPKKQHIIIRGHSHHRDRPGLFKSSRFTAGSNFDPLVKILIDEMELGMIWNVVYNNRRGPSFIQIVEGLLLEVARQTESTMGNMDQLLILEAKANLKKTWEYLFSLVDIPNKDQ